MERVFDLTRAGGRSVILAKAKSSFLFAGGGSEL